MGRGGGQPAEGRQEGSRKDAADRGSCQVSGPGK